MRIAALILSTLALAVSAGIAAAGEAQIAVAANFARPMEALIVRFEAETGHRVRASYGSTGKFYAQIKNGAPFEALLAADGRRPMLLADEGVAVPESRFTYAIGRLVLWSAKPDAVDDGAALLKAGGFARLAIANPKLAPYGEAAMQTLAHLDIGATVATKLVRGESISQTYQFVDSGNAQLGLVALSQVMVDGVISKGSGWIVPAEMHAPISQDAVVLKRGAENPVVSELFAYLQTEQARGLIRDFGYQNADD